jgi:D-alanyl-D-alanine carboxypeptidase/D-alanyl-D-alanine-endopeptidase (penicillin-binding protein 4)
MRSSKAPRLALALLATLGLSGACAARQPAASVAATRPAAGGKAVRDLRADLDRVFGAPIMSRGVWAVDVRSVDTGEPLYGLNADKLMMPASNMKIVTLAAAAETLGWDHRFTTTLEIRGPVMEGILLGDLIVRGTGDPSINSREKRADTVLDQWAAALRGAGITSIEGRIVGEDQAFDDEGIGAGWAWDYLQYGYAAPVGALEFNENIATLTVLPGPATGDPAIVNLTAGTGFTIINRAITGEAGSPETIDYKRHLDRPVLEITGSVPPSAGPQSRTVGRTVAVVNPTVFFAQQVKDGLTARGIPVTGDAVDFDDVAAGFMVRGSTEQTADDDAGTKSNGLQGHGVQDDSGANNPGLHGRLLVTTQSPPLREIATVLMKVSQNLYAETLLKAVGAKAGGLGTWESGRRATRALLTEWGVPPDAFVMSDGSGLSRYNYVTARMLTTILERLHKDPRHRDAFVATLPIAGKDGTIATRMRRSRAEGNAVAKTGSIANVRSLSGYVRTRDGETLVFSVLTNDFVIPSATVNWIADLGIEILANFTR